MEEEMGDQIGIDPIPDAMDMKGEVTATILNMAVTKATKANTNRTGKTILIF